jgi:hypothetical protein
MRLRPVLFRPRCAQSLDARAPPLLGIDDRIEQRLITRRARAARR